MTMFRNLDEVVETLRGAKRRNRSCSLLIGAGCSVKAGVPTAEDFVKIIRDDYPQAYRRAGSPATYPRCMAELAPDERRDLIAHHVDRAHINWAHIAIAQLIKTKFVHRVLTTNFDLLVVRACALLGFFPASYDFAASQLFDAADIPDPAIFHLHGQRTGFVLMNTQEEVDKHSGYLAPVFEDAGKGRVWLVVGYSGDNDPVFNHLAAVPHFNNNLYWIGYTNSEPAPHVRDRLLTPGKNAFYVKGHDSDGFFIALARKLGCFPPDLISAPFAHLDALLETVADFEEPELTEKIDILADAKRRIQKAKAAEVRELESAKSETSTESVSVQLLNALYVQGDYDKVIELGTRSSELSAEVKTLVSSAYTKRGTALAKAARTKQGDEADLLTAEAAGEYAAALAIQPDSHAALNNWGTTLLDQAERKTGKVAEQLRTQAIEKYAAALALKPDYYQGLSNWGAVLSSQAQRNTGDDADRLWAQAVEKYAASLAMRPDYSPALYNWGETLSDQAKQKDGTAAELLLAEASDKLSAAHRLDINHAGTLILWAEVLQRQADFKSGAEADQLRALAAEKLAVAKALTQPASNQ